MQTFLEVGPESRELVERAQRVTCDVIERESAGVDREGRFPRAGVAALGEAGLLGLTIARKWGGLEQGPRTFVAVAEAISRACPSTGMVYVMHVCAANVIAAAPSPHEKVLREIASGKHLATLAFSEKGSRSHFWAPVSREAPRGAKTLLSAE
jgi:alkylation response protein AidB-like acyl-CoA dehydrogenase